MAEEGGGAPLTQKQIRAIIANAGGTSIPMMIATHSGGKLRRSFFELRIPTMDEAIETGVIRRRVSRWENGR